MSVWAVTYTVEIRVAIASAEGAWHALERLPDAAREFAYSAGELASLLAVYGRAVASMLRCSDGERFSITAFDIASGKVAGRNQWAWSQRAGAYEAQGDPLVVW